MCIYKLGYRPQCPRYELSTKYFSQFCALTCIYLFQSPYMSITHSPIFSLSLSTHTHTHTHTTTTTTTQNTAVVSSQVFWSYWETRWHWRGGNTSGEDWMSKVHMHMLTHTHIHTHTHSPLTPHTPTPTPTPTCPPPPPPPPPHTHTHSNSNAIFHVFFSVCVCVAGNTTGATSVFTVFEGHEIMFHVSTLLPYSTGNEQQV